VSGRASYNNVALARDARRAAVVQTEPLTNNTDIWLIDLARGIPTRFRFDDAVDRDPVWSPDNTRVAFSSSRGHGPFQPTSRIRAAYDLRSSFRSPTYPSEVSWREILQRLLGAMEEEATALKNANKRKKEGHHDGAPLYCS
jgi:dipeptidyl aminopeptidase/acylaminoacyl peptidase